MPRSSQQGREQRAEGKSRSSALCSLLFALTSAAVVSALFAQSSSPPRRNVILFVADGLRPGSVNATDTPALWSVRTNGVNFINSHSVFPSLTMPNAAAIATGHEPGDTGQFANNLNAGFPLFNTGNFGRGAGPLSATTENDLILGDLDDHFGGRYIGEPTLLEVARAQGFSTAAIGKTGPTAMQDVGQLAPSQNVFVTPSTIILDDSTGTNAGIPVHSEVASRLKAAGLTPAPPARNQPAGTNTTPGTLAANVMHQQWYVDAVTKVIVPVFSSRGKPFVVVFWSGDPDQTQHAQGDSLNRLVPGVNGPTSTAAVRNADSNLKQILDSIAGDAELAASTDIFVTSDHGFSTVSRHEIDREGHATKSYSAGFTYKTLEGRQEVNDGFLPNSFLAIDLAHALDLPLYDPETPVTDRDGVRVYKRVDPAVSQSTGAALQKPTSWSGLIGGTGRITTPIDGRVLITAQLIYVLDNSRDMVERIVRVLDAQDYIGGIFVNDMFGSIPGSLPMSAINLIGRSAKLPKPSIVVSFRNFSTDPANPLMTGVIVGGTQQHGQGNHGSLSRANTFNNMAAIGPDFKKGFVDAAPAGNIDIAPTLASILGIKLPGSGSLRGRILREAMAGGPSTIPSEKKIIRSRASATGNITVLMHQEAGSVRYLDEACLGRALQSCGTW